MMNVHVMNACNKNRTGKKENIVAVAACGYIGKMRNMNSQFR